MSRPVRFAGHLLDPANATLRRGAEPVRLTPKAFDVLAYLAARPGQLVSKEELLAGVWDDPLVTDASLAVCVREVRKALADDAHDPKFIATVHRRGYRFVAEITAAPPPSGRLLAPEPVGRAAELAELRGRLDRAVAGRRQVVFVSGPAGCGKTAVVESLTRDALGRGVPVAVGQCFEQYGPGEAYLPVLDALTRLARQPGTEALPGLVAAHAPSWAAQLPWARPAARDPFAATPERMLRELADLLDAVTAASPLLLVLEDLHWADAPTADLLAALARRPGAARLLVVGTVRPVELILNDHPLKRVRQDLAVRKLATELPLDPLGVGAVAEYLRGKFGAEPAAAFAEAVHRRTDGLPLFVVNLCDHLAERGAVVGADLRPGFDLAAAVPDAVRPMIELQVGRLSADQQTVLEAAAAAGVEFCAATAAAALGADVVATEQVCEGLARRHQFLDELDTAVWPDGTAAARYRFRHELYYQAVAERLSAARRGQYHRRIADRLEAAYAGRLGEVAARLAYHADQGPDHPRAVRALALAADAATARFAHREAADYLRRALARTATASDRIALTEGIGLSRRAVGDSPGSAAAFADMREAARAAGDPAAEVRALFLVASAASWYDRERCLTASDTALSLAAGVGDPTLAARAAGWSAYWNLAWRGWADADAAAAGHAVAVARAVGDDALVVTHLGRYAFFVALRGEYDAAAELAGEAAGLACRLGGGFDHLLAEFYRAWALLHAGRWDELAGQAATAARTAGRHGHHRWERLFRLFDCWRLLETGYAAAADAVWAGAEAVGDGASPFGELMSGVLRGRTLVALGRVAEAAAVLDGWADRLDRQRMLMDWVWRMPLHLARGECRLAAGRPAEARAEAERVCGLAAGPGEPTYRARGRRLVERSTG